MDNSRTPRFYLLPNIHKPGNPGRPIVSACNCPKELIATYLDTITTPLVQNLPSYAKDTKPFSPHRVLRLNSFSFNGKFYNQTGAVAKVSRLGPNYKCLFMGHIEDQIFKFDLYTRRTPDLYKWYIDDIAGAFCGFATVTNDFQPSLNL